MGEGVEGGEEFLSSSNPKMLSIVNAFFFTGSEIGGETAEIGGETAELDEAGEMGADGKNGCLEGRE